MDMTSLCRVIRGKFINTLGKDMVNKGKFNKDTIIWGDLIVTSRVNLLK